MLSSTTSPLKKSEPIGHLPNSMQKLITQMQRNTKRSKKVTNMLPVKRPNTDKNGCDFAGLVKTYSELNNINNKLSAKPPKTKRALLSTNENIDFPNNDGEDVANNLTNKPEMMTLHGQHQQMIQSSSNNFGHSRSENGKSENSERYSASGKAFTYPSAQDTSDHNSYSTNSECITSESEKTDYPNIPKNKMSDHNENDTTRFRADGMRSSIKTSSGGNRKKWVTFNDIIQSEKISFVDELYDNEDEQDESQDSTNSAVHEDRKLSGVISMNVLTTQPTHQPFTMNGQTNLILQTPGCQEKLKKMIQQIRQMNDMITKARNEILRFSYDRQK